MNAASIESNRFALLLAPDLGIARVMASQHLAMLNSRICRPLDLPLFGLEQPGLEQPKVEPLEQESPVPAPAVDA